MLQTALLQNSHCNDSFLFNASQTHTEICLPAWLSHCNSSVSHYQECNIPASSLIISVDVGNMTKCHHPLSLCPTPEQDVNCYVPAASTMHYPTETVASFPFPLYLMQLNCYTVHTYKLTTKLKIYKIYSSARLQHRTVQACTCTNTNTCTCIKIL
jgi:hypothetical protein